LAFDDAVVRRRFRDLLGRIVGSNAGGIRYLSIGNEVDLYLGNHTPEIAAYTAFFQDAAQAARALDPAIQVGVTGTGAGALGAGQTLLRDLNDAASDVVILTYYPVEPDQAGNVSVRDPSVVSGDFQRLLAFAGTKPIVLQEAGFPASGDNGSSTALQAEFMRQLFVAWRAAGGRIPFLNIFLLHDFPSLVCDELLAYYGLSSSGSLKSALCSLGLRTVDGTPRPAWESVLDEARQAHLP
jgi:hypothetical protein